MILNCGATFVQWRPMRLRTVCLASPSTTAQQLRQQLDSLHKEAESIRNKANYARLRLMRLSEAAEKLRRQASVSVQTGKENDARDLLFQKKNVMQAMEKLKNRIELFDELSSKLNEAITMKEGLLVGNMALDLEVSEIETPSPIRIISLEEKIPSNSEDNQEVQVFVESQAHIHEENDGDNQDGSFSKKRWDNSENFPRRNSPYEDFIQKLDEDLNKIEQELEIFLRFSNLLLERREKPEYSKVQQVMEILDGVRQTRERISNVMQTASFNEPC